MARRASLVLVCLLLGAAPRVGAEEPDAAAARARREMAVLASIPGAVARGARLVRACRQDDGSFHGFGEAPDAERFARLHRFGKTALATLTLLHTGAGPDDAVVADGLRFLRRRWRETMSGHGLRDASTYSLALFAMALHALGERAVAAGEPPARVTAANPLGLESWARGAVRSIHRWLLRTRGSDGLYSYPLPSGPSSARAGASVAWLTSDLSNTQYALLGLWAGTRCGESVEVGTLEGVAAALLAAQEGKGRYVRRTTDAAAHGDDSTQGPRDRARGFAYRSLAGPLRHPVTGAMTAGGLSSLLIVKALLREQAGLDPDLEAALDRAIWDAVAWLAHHYDVRVNPVGRGAAVIPEAVRRQFEARGDVIDQAGWHAYYLYALERALVIGGKRFLGAHDWYVDGAELLLAAQGEDGAWRSPRAGAADALGRGAYPDPLVDTCFSLLFLKRATLRPRSPLLAR